MAEVVLEGVSKRFGNVTAVEGVDLTVADGEFFVLLGPTGAGKTTTLRLIAGLERPDGGRVKIGGRDVTETQAAARDVAFVFQQYSLYPHMTVFENLAFPLRAPLRRRAKAEIRNRVEHVAALLQIESKLQNKATELSGGEMQRVSIGRALVREPAAFLMDEPLSSLDAKLRERLRVEIKRIQRDLGATIVYVTHDHVEALSLGDRIGVLRHGQLLQVAPPRVIYDDPDSVFVARQLGSPQINLLPPEVLGLDGAIRKDVAEVGLRPEDIHVGEGAVPAKVLQVERLGAENVLILETREHHLRAVAGPATHLHPGERITFAFAADRVLCFDRDGARVRDGFLPNTTEARRVSHAG